jgi:hypothetical protein
MIDWEETMKARPARVIMTLLLSGALVIMACGSEGDTEANPPASGTGGSAGAEGGLGGTGSSATGGSSGSGGIQIGCDPACTPPQFCSVTDVCIDEGTCAAPGDCPEGMTCDDATSTCVPGGECGGQEATAEAVPPNLLLVLDRSCSMTAKVASVTKWEIAVGAINTMTTSFLGKIRFGLTLFPDRGDGKDCQQTNFPVPVGPDNEQAIQDLLTASLVASDANFPDGPCVTNIDTAMQQAATDPALQDTERDSYVVLITDGKQAGCNAAGGDNGTTQIIGDLFANEGVPTFVIGFGDGIDPVQMDIFAQAGGVPSADPAADYYKAEDQASLDAALAEIASKTLGCVYDLEETPEDANKIYVFFDNTAEVPRDPNHEDGWDYDPATNQVTFYGDACDTLKAGEVDDVDIVFGCKAPTPT